MKKTLARGYDLWDKMRGKEVPERALVCLLCCIFIVVLIPMVMIAFYDIPSADDYSYSLLTHEAWVQTHSVWAVLRAAWEQVKTTYGNWQGTFFSVFLFSLQPGLWTPRLYFLTPFIMLASLFSGTAMFVDTLLRRVLGATRTQVCLTVIVILAAYTQLLPGAVQGFYWYNGAIYYTFSFGLSLILYSLVIRYIQSAPSSPLPARLARLLLISLLSVLIGGSNYVTALTTAMFYFVVLCVLLAAKRPRSLDLLLPFALFLTAFIVSMAAPGNAVRQSHFPNHPSIIMAIPRSFRIMVHHLHSWCTLPLLCIVIFLVPILWHLTARPGLRFPVPLLVLLFSVCVLAAMFSPPIYAMCSSGDTRLTDIIYDAFVLILLFDVFYVIGWLRCAVIRAECPAPRYTQAFITVIALFMLAGCAFEFDSQFTSLSALQSLVTGEAASYHDTYEQRLEILQNAEEPAAVLPDFQSKPYVLYLYDIQPQADAPLNMTVADYYGKASVVLKTPDDAPDI